MTDTEKSIRSMENLNMVLSITKEERYAVNLAIKALQEKSEREKGCGFCCYEEDGKLYPKDGYTFYAGYNKQIDVDEFDERESEEIKICPMCGRKLVQK